MNTINTMTITSTNSDTADANKERENYKRKVEK